ncbi:unnamed protein product [Larinioides sclopetarius]
MIVAGNSAVLVALVLSKNRKSRMNFFIMHLAIADLTVGVINVLTDIIWRTTVAFYADNIACKLIKYLQALVTYSSTYVLVALSVDRYDAIAHPMNFSTSWRKARWLVASAWGASAVFSIPSAFLSSKEEVKGMSQCWIDLDPWQWQLYITLVAASLFFVPALVIAACYTVIVHTIWTKSRLMSYPKLSKSSIADSKKSEYYPEGEKLPNDTRNVNSCFLHNDKRINALKYGDHKKETFLYLNIEIYAETYNPDKQNPMIS